MINPSEEILAIAYLFETNAITSLDRIAYRLNKEDGIQLAVDLNTEGLLPSISGQSQHIVDIYLSSGIGWKLVNGKMYSGVKIIVEH